MDNILKDYGPIDKIDFKDPETIAGLAKALEDQRLVLGFPSNPTLGERVAIFFLVEELNKELESRGSPIRIVPKPAS